MCFRSTWYFTWVWLLFTFFERWRILIFSLFYSSQFFSKPNQFGSSLTFAWRHPSPDENPDSESWPFLGTGYAAPLSTPRPAPRWPIPPFLHVLSAFTLPAFTLPFRRTPRPEQLQTKSRCSFGGGWHRWPHIADHSAPFFCLNVAFLFQVILIQFSCLPQITLNRFRPGIFAFSTHYVVTI